LFIHVFILPRSDIFCTQFSAHIFCAVLP